ncbi:hypothetical protein B0O99DRAFT_663707 [Bisporella sp. PMI_857]|nr:hypothetical protein B0O99DRAFT_663707 [Bisporella sp. PMI_857]
MSGSEGGLVIGWISGTIAIIDAITKVYDATQDAEGLPQAFREVTQRLPLVRDTLQATEGHMKRYNLGDESCIAMKPVVEGCKDKAVRLETIFQKVIPQADTSRLDRYYKAVRTLGKGNRVEALMKGMLEDVQLLAGNHAIKAATEAQIEQLAKAIEELSGISPSLPEHISEDSSPAITNYGSGPQNIHSGLGDQNNNTGSGKQYIAQTQNFGKG